MALNIHEIATVNEDMDKCIICLESLNNETNYSLPECSHTYHQNCIMHWFRNGSNKCPLCNNLGVNDLSSSGSVNNSGCRWWDHKYRYTKIRQFSRKKDAPKKLKKDVANLKKVEEKLNQLRQEKKNLNTTIGEFGDLKKKWNSLRIKEWRLKSSIRKKKVGLANFNIVHLIIAKKINV